jgi:RNA-binding protein FUS
VFINRREREENIIIIIITINKIIKNEKSLRRDMPPHPSKEENDDGALPLPPPPPPPPPPEEDAPALRFGTGLNNNNNNNNTNFNNNNNNNEKEENKAKKLSEDGSWQCDSCSNTNFAWRKTCKRCDLPKSQKVKDEEKKAAAGWLLDGVDDPTNNRIFVKGFDPETTTSDDLRELFGGIGMISRVRQRTGFPDQWPWAVKIYSDESTGKNKDECTITYDDPMAAQSAPGFYDGYDFKGKKISVSLATKKKREEDDFSRDNNNNNNNNYDGGRGHNSYGARGSYGGGGGRGRGGRGGDGCRICGRSGHFARECPDNRGGGGRGGGYGNYNRGGGGGHYRRDRPY